MTAVLAELLSVLLTLVPSLAVLAEPLLPATVLVLALGALRAGRRAGLVLLLARPAPAPPTSYDESPRLRGRATDPVGHPQRARAPGIA